MLVFLSFGMFIMFALEYFTGFINDPLYRDSQALSVPNRQALCMFLLLSRLSCSDFQDDPLV